MSPPLLRPLSRPRLRELLSTDAGLTILLLSLCSVLFVIYPFVPLGGGGRMLVSLGLTIVLVAGSFSLADRPFLHRFIVGLAAIAFVTHWLSNVTDHPHILIGSYLSTLLFLGLTGGGVLAKVMRKGRINSQRIQGAIAVYLIIGLIWGFAYALVELRQPGSFNLPPAESSAGVTLRGDERVGDLMYFSFVTLTTLGYGDITPLSAGARNLALIEALVGQLYLVILIARLVSLQIAHSDLVEGDDEIAP